MSNPESALLRSLEQALHEVTPTDPPKEGVSFSEWVRQFTYEYGPLIEQMADFQLRAQFDPQLQALSAAAAEVSTVGPDGKINPGALDVVERITQNPQFAALSQASASFGVRGFGLLTLNVEAALLLGVQVGAELVMMREYSIGDYTVPSDLIGRAWYQVTAGLDLGISGTVMLFPLNLSCWFVPPVNTKHLVSVFATYIPLPTAPFFPSSPFLTGLRLEIFGWLPEGSAPGAEIDFSDFIDHIHGFRLVLEIGRHKGIGAGFRGHQVATSGGFQKASLSITPNNLQPGPKYDLKCTISAPRSAGNPVRILRSNTTLKLEFPRWVFSAMGQTPVTTFANDGTGAATGWKPTSTAGDNVLGFDWHGDDNTAWKQDMTFTIASGYSNDVAPQEGDVTCTLNNLDSFDSRLELSVSQTPMTLSPLVFNAAGNYDLKVNTQKQTIENQPPGTKELTGSVNATTANSADNHDNDFYPILDPTDKNKILTVDDTSGNSYWCGYQYLFDKDADVVCAKYRAIFWKTNTAASDRNYFYGTWVDATADNTTHSVAWWNNNSSSGTSLDIFLKPTG